MTDALEGGFGCATCGDRITGIVDLLDHATGDCDRILHVDVLSSSERSTLLYVESQIVDGGALLDHERMNYIDFNNLKLFASAGLLDVEEVDTREPKDEVVKFTDEAWDLAAACRKKRGLKNLDE